MGGSSGGIPNVSGGFFPMLPQFNSGNLPVWDLGMWGANGGVGAPPMLNNQPGGGIFSQAPLRPPMAAAAPPQQRRAPYDAGLAGVYGPSLAGYRNQSGHGGR